MKQDATSPLFTYDPRLGRHRYKSNGRMVSLKEVKAQTQRVVNFKVAELQTLGRYLVEQKITLSAWELATAETLKMLHLQTLLLEKGGLQNITADDNLAVSRNLKSEYSYLKEFAQQIYRGEVTPNQFYSRLKKYVQNTQVVTEIVKRQKAVFEGLMKWAQRTPGSNAKHCPDCPGYAGVFPANQVIMRGEQCVCGDKCNCGVEFFAEDPRLAPLT